MDEVSRLAKHKGVKAVHRENIKYGTAQSGYGAPVLGDGDEHVQQFEIHLRREGRHPCAPFARVYSRAM